ncbi:MAG: DUF2207 domain-containing protein, partial [Chromatiaceae bacterium]
MSIAVRMRLGRILVAALLAAAASLATARAAEEIRLFESTIEIAPDGELRVTETIQVRAEGRQIRRGIFRDFPNTFEDAEGRVHRNSFDLVSVTRDGQRDGSRTERGSSFLRVYVGKDDVLLDP